MSEQHETEKRWADWFLNWQFETNCLASVAIEEPWLRPALRRRLEAFDDPHGIRAALATQDTDAEEGR